MRSDETGFSLVEVLVALAVLGLALLALLRLNAANAGTAVALERATFGDIVAENALVEALVGKTPPAYGAKMSEARNGSESWQVTRIASRSEQPGIMLIRIDVRDASGNLAASLSGMRETG